MGSCLKRKHSGVDADSRFEEIFDRYYKLLDDRSMITAVYVAWGSAEIVRARPELEARVTSRLLGIDETHHDPERRDLIKADIMETFSGYFKIAGARRPERGQKNSWPGRRMDSAARIITIGAAGLPAGT